MKMPMSEILDRYTITMLKSERTGNDVSEELRTYKEETVLIFEVKTESFKAIPSPIPLASKYASNALSGTNVISYIQELSSQVAVGS